MHGGDGGHLGGKTLRARTAVVGLSAGLRRQAAAGGSTASCSAPGRRGPAVNQSSDGGVVRLAYIIRWDEMETRLGSQV
jgi:hypothetical protein